MTDDGPWEDFAGRQDDAVFYGGAVVDLGIVPHELEDPSIGLHGHLAVPAVHPGGDLAGKEPVALLGQGAQGIRQLEFTPLAHIAVDELADFAAQSRAVLEVIDANHRQVGNGFFGLFRILSDHAFAVEHDDSELFRVLNALHEEVTVGCGIQGKVGAEEGVGKGDHRLALQQVFGAPDGMGRAQRLLLVADVAGCSEGVGQGEQVRLDLRSEVADDEGDVVEGPGRHRREVLHEALDNGLARHMDERLRNGEGVRPEAAAPPGHGDDEVHSVPVCPNPPAPRSVRARSAG